MNKKVNFSLYLDMVILALFSLCLTATAQIANGPHKTYYDDGTLKTEAIYEDGKLNGEAKAYHPNGQIKTEVNFKDGKRHGQRKVYNELGQLQAKENYNMGVLDDISCSYVPETGRIFVVYPYKNGKLHGTHTVYSRQGLEGQKFIEEEYVEGKKEGRSVMFNLNGTLSKISTYKNDLLDGPTTHYDEKGLPIRSEIYKEGVKVE
ncbi:MAG: toxin-antitoxin system YwqK family antitoxin [Candidatus Omnitrophica bacterium]|nr:toxin-antitoxin system YwqK family antitoxin [Candidatus Omnitrophota bacterium]